MREYRHKDIPIPFTRAQLHVSRFGRAIYFAVSRMPHIVSVMVSPSFKGWDWGPFRWRSMHEFHLGPVTLCYCQWQKTFGHIFNNQPPSNSNDDNSRTDPEQPSDQPSGSSSDRAEHQEPAGAGVSIPDQQGR